MTQTMFPSNLFETCAYDADNNLTSKTDRKSQTIQYIYDALNRLTQTQPCPVISGQANLYLRLAPPRQTAVGKRKEQLRRLRSRPLA